MVNSSISGYTFFHINSTSNAGGVGAYVSDLIQTKEFQFNTTFYDFESLWLQFTCPGTDLDCGVGTVYRHPNTNVEEGGVISDKIYFCDSGDKIYFCDLWSMWEKGWV